MKSRLIRRPADSSGFGVSERAFDGRPLFGLHRGEHRRLVVLVEILDQRDRVVGLHLLGEVGDGPRGQRLDEQLANVIVQFGEHLAAHQI
jgi:hypothetical protein